MFVYLKRPAQNWPIAPVQRQPVMQTRSITPPPQLTKNAYNLSFT